MAHVANQVVHVPFPVHRGQDGADGADLELDRLRCYFMTNVSTQICVAAFLWIKLRPDSLGREVLPAHDAIRNSLALGLGSVGPVAAIIMIKSFVLL